MPFHGAAGWTPIARDATATQLCGASDCLVKPCNCARPNDRLLLLIVPGLLAYAYYLLGAPVAALENLKVGPAISRGSALAKGEYRRIILVAGLSGLLYMLLLFAVGVVVGMVTTSEPMTLLAFTAAQILMLPVLVAITVLLYYDIRERR